MNTQNLTVYLLNVSYYKKHNPSQVSRLSETHFNMQSAQKVIKRLQFLGYTIEHSSIKSENKNYVKAS